MPIEVSDFVRSLGWCNFLFLEETQMIQFFDRLYENIGSKIKTLAIAFFIVQAIGAIVTGIILLIDGGFEYNWWAIFIILLGPVVAFVDSWLLYGFGEIIDQLTYISDKSSLIYQSQNDKKITAPETTQNNVPQKQQTIKNDVNTLKSVPDKSADRVSVKGSYSLTGKGTMICSACNCEQPAGRRICWNCSVKFSEENHTDTE